MDIEKPEKQPSNNANQDVKNFDNTRRTVLFWVMAIFSVLIGIYGILYWAIPIDEQVFYYQTFNRARGLFYFHAIVGGLSLVLGPWQFRKSIRSKYLSRHRWIGRLWVIACFLTGVTGFVIGLNSTGGISQGAGFMALGILTAGFSVYAFYLIRFAKDFAGHRRYMLRAWGCIFAAVTLRIQLPILLSLFGLDPVSGDAPLGYMIVAYSSWIPNLIWVEWWLNGDK